MATHIEVRLATLMDLDRLLKMVVAFKEHLQIQGLSNRDINTSLEILLADPMCDFAIATPSAGTGCGYAQLRYFYSLWSTGLEAKLEDLFVYPEVRRQGLGSQLLTFMVGCAHQRQCRLIALNTNERNLAALNLYAQQGFRSQPSRWRGGHQLWLENLYDREI
ncbi:MAG: GNAT family N-acetyltransferase [Acaryochloridaceae cyanobacterium CSU_3_4]|nr:GNAT family N-acetyltransferase [Acaryochloridaceae cyanobacterium CSU_3_4]